VKRWLRRIAGPEATIRRLRLEPGDTLVICIPQPITADQAEAIKRHIDSALPGVPVLVFDTGISLAVVRHADAS
jgi:hypothetical protein